METAKCKLIEYRGKYYLEFSEKRELKTGDRVLTPYTIALCKILGPAGGWDKEGFYSVTNTSSCVSLWGNALNVVAATEEEISPEDLSRIKHMGHCEIILINGKPCFVEGKIAIKF